MKAKPIFIAYLPKYIDTEHIINIQAVLEKRIEDYNILCVSDDVKSVKFDVFYEKDYKQEDFEELKKIVLEKLNG